MRSKYTRKLHIAWAPDYVHPLPEGHRFPMIKYELIPEQLIYEGVISESSIFEPPACEDEIVLLTHTSEYLAKLKSQTLSPQEQRRIGFPQSPELTLRELVITQGTIDCCEPAKKHGVALNVAGGTHHAFAAQGEGFCLLNDCAVAANYLLHQHLASRILIIDLDVHQGNGTASIFFNRPEVFTFSMHGRNNFPFRKEKSDLDVELEDGTTDDVYLHLLETHLPRILASFQPDFAFYVCGVDILATDMFGKLKVTGDGCLRRDRFVFNTLKDKGVPVVAAMGGGYSPHIKDIVDAHCQTFKAAADIFELH